MCETKKDICENYAFRFLNNVDKPAIKLINIGKEIRYSKEYYYDNRTRYSSCIFQYTLNGSGTLKIGNQKYTIKNGDAFFITTPSDTVYYFDEDKNENPWEFIYITFDGDAVLPYYEYAVNHLGKVIHLSSNHPAVKLLLDLHFKAKNELIENAFLADSEAFRFLCLLCDTKINSDNHRSNLIDNAKTYIESNYSKQITLQQVSAYLGVSQSHLSREFVKRTGEQAVHYLTKTRLERAAEMLISTDISLDYISKSCGFSDSNYFSKVFKKHMKISPSEFRKQMKIQKYISVKI